MGTHAENAYQLFQQYIGHEDEIGDWFLIDQARINLFGDAVNDHQSLHVDPEKCAKFSPYKVPIAHGFLTLSLFTFLCSSARLKDIRVYDGLTMAINYGFDKVRFPSPVKVNSRVRALRKLVNVELKDPHSLQITYHVTIEIEGEKKPAIVAEWLTRLGYA
jgi:acyl dehydratase